MNDNGVVQRQNWFRFFPEGSIEFVVVTRVLALLLLVAVVIVKETQQPRVLVALATVLWADYLLMLWWAVQMATDLEDLFEKRASAVGASPRRRLWSAALGALPSTIALLLLAPWPHLVLGTEADRAAAARVAVPVLGAVLLVSMFVGQRALQRVRLGPAVWTLLFLIPIVHWFAMHRLLAGLHARLQERSQEQGQSAAGQAGPGAAVVVADVTWVLSILPWGIMLVLGLLGGSSRAGPLHLAAPVCGTLFAALFAVADVAAMENAQRRFVALLRRL